MNYKIIKICDIFIYCEITLKIQTADSKKMFFYNYVENVKMKITDIIFIFSIFIAEKIENELIFKCF